MDSEKTSLCVETDDKSECCLFKPNLDCNYIILIDVEANGILFCAKSIGMDGWNLDIFIIYIFYMYIYLYIYLFIHIYFYLYAWPHARIAGNCVFRGKSRKSSIWKHKAKCFRKKTHVIIGQTFLLKIYIRKSICYHIMKANFSCQLLKEKHMLS